ncbi:MAG TPA: AsmA-like C-terminal domain-containing protein, partial [Rhizomicrobium sp.]|nr:AsmA-like C-terminal domain-containing protein [Rhizomicrobium sp.]
LRAGVSIAPFILDTNGVEDRLQSLSLSGNYSHNGMITGSMTNEGGTRRLAISATDAGTFFKGLFGFTSIKGGKLGVTADFPRPANAAPDPSSATPDFQGEASLKDFRVLHQPFLLRVFTAGSLLGFINLMSSTGIEVDTLTLPYTSKHGVLSIRDARASGPAIGVSADGYIDRPNNQLALRGSIAPLYMVNSLLGMIPLLGNVLTSKEGEGIVGMTYTLKGDADEPDVSVNPLSVLTPGILRRIFEGRIPTPPQAKTAPAASTQTPAAQPSATGAH